MTDGFTVQLNEVEKAARQCLTPVADYLHDRAKTLKASELAGKGPAAKLASTYRDYVDLIGDRQTEGCARIDDTATALLEIADLYRHVDGRG